MSGLDEKTAMKKMGRAMTATMPPLLKLQIMFKMLLAGKDGEKRRKVMEVVKERRRFTVPRNQIEWYPTIDYQKCQSCQVCLEFCPKGVFTRDDEGRVVVAHPYECVMLCSGCEIKCPQGAISFPDRKEFYKYVYYV
jgi:NAD-dependent dihydropyrimidine dehydrogenase PreA subunit